MIWYFLIALILVTLIVMTRLIIYSANQKLRNKKQIKLKDNWRAYFDEIFNEVDGSNHMMQEEKLNKLRSIEELLAFFSASKAYLNAPDPEVREQFRPFIRSNKNGFIELGQHYLKRKLIEQAYFAYVCEQFRINEPEENDELTTQMLSIALEPSINNRENALKALNAFGNTDAMVAVFKQLSQAGTPHHRKLVTDGLLAFKGDQNELAHALYEHFDDFKDTYQVAMIDFFRLSEVSLSANLIELLEKGDSDKEVLCAVLRYYGKYPVQAYKEIILSYLAQTFNESWECVSTAAAVLSHYPGDDTIQALKVALSSKYWYVRLNAARSIADLGVSEESLMDILEGQDVFAKEQLIYHMASVRERGIQNG